MLIDDKQFHNYVTKCAAPVGWDGEQSVDFFRLIGLIWKGFPQYRKNVEKFLNKDALTQTTGMVDKEFHLLMSAERRELISRCLHLRLQLLMQAIEMFRKEEQE